MCNRIAQGLFVPLQVSFDNSFFNLKVVQNRHDTQVKMTF